MIFNHPCDFKAPRLTFDSIRQEADSFRERYWGSDSLPIDIFFIAEEKLSLNIVPIKNLKSNNDIDALLYDQCQSIVVDNDEYMDDRFLNRIRFSFAHEIAHLVLHKELYDSIIFHSIDQWQQAILQIPEREYFFIEQQAYEFAGRLLVPRDNLLNSVTQLKPEIDKFKSLSPNIDFNIIKPYIATKICKEYGVSDQVIIKRLDIEKLDNYF
ncbi:MAG: ImmA/IrrE family metallo-endopeptidase [Ignavibacteriales bacterium]|nr:ImmA/IrrE family metallo-endopeptidase [Ignavibacteriales bacterium]